ncbi:serine/threonine protein kinase [Amycolatopsis sp. lyj-112]|uniref:serine/threonine protein kinase n=1 Tax=Amycolatopsis sp. lyj-112 TaxID=2789288 RepID=UPI00397B122E
MRRAGSVWLWSLISAVVAAALGTAINFATDLKTDFLAWGLVVAFTLATGMITGVSQSLITRNRENAAEPGAGTTTIYGNVQHSQVNFWLVILILGIAGSLLAATLIGVHFSGSLLTSGSPRPAVTEPLLDSPPSTRTAPLPEPTRTLTTTRIPTPTPVTEPRPSGLTDFVTAYYRLMPDTQAGWPLIGPNLQRRGRAGYEAHWGKIDKVDVHRATTTSATTVEVRITLHYRDGRPAPTETHELTVVPCDDGPCIDADTLISAK